MPIFLFDIDGTLLHSGGAGKAALEAALVTLHALEGIQHQVPYSGRTDGDICRELLERHGLPTTPETVRALHDAYLANLPDSLTKHGGKVLPGVTELLGALCDSEYAAVGLLTGNIRSGAMTKLGHFGLADLFPFGGFGDGHLDRDDVARAALADAARYFESDIDPAEVWVIGDTPLDIRCARAIGAKVCAVATGSHPITELADAKPDLLFPDLSHYPILLATTGVG